jgi:hypothetical protein
MKSKRQFWVSCFIFNLLVVSFPYCNAQRENSIDKKKEICRNQAFIALNARSKLNFTGSVSFKYSCSATAGYSPSCFEYFASFEKDDLCPIGYLKSKAKCSTQNLIGVCRYVPLDTNGQTITVIFTQPSDSLDQAQAFCASADKNGIFSNLYLEPTAVSTSLEQALINYILCDNRAEKN